MKYKYLLILTVLVGLLLSACSQTGQTNLLDDPIMEDSMLTISSSAFGNQEGIPVKYTCDGDDINPPLNWSGVPEEAKSLVLIMDDPDAPVGTWDHWLLYNLPPEMNELKENTTALPAGTQAGKNSWKKTSYGGPCPPGGASHHYYFKLYALDISLDLADGANKKELTNAMQGHVLAKSELIGIYKP